MGNAKQIGMNTATYRDLLMNKRAELAGNSGRREEIETDRKADIIDDIQSSMDRDLAVVVINQNWSAVRAIDSALDRIVDGTYGECAECGEAIAEKRLQALPWAECCRDCQERAERHNGRVSTEFLLDAA